MVVVSILMHLTIAVANEIYHTNAHNSLQVNYFRHFDYYLCDVIAACFYWILIKLTN